MAEPTLSDQLQGRPTHPLRHVELSRPVCHADVEGVAELRTDQSQGQDKSDFDRLAHSFDCSLKDRQQVAHVSDRENRIEHLALSAVAFAFPANREGRIA